VPDIEVLLPLTPVEPPAPTVIVYSTEVVRVTALLEIIPPAPPPPPPVDKFQLKPVPPPPPPAIARISTTLSVADAGQLFSFLSTATAFKSYMPDALVSDVDVLLPKGFTLRISTSRK
jgi:hypothetical protein